MLVHTVIFWLKPELNDAQRAEFRKGVEALAAIKTLSAIYVGSPAATEERPPIDHSFSVMLTTVFKDIAAHDAYQVDPVHLNFINTFKNSWTRFQVYDAE